MAITADSVPYDGGSVTLDNTGSAVDRNFNPAVQNHPYRLTATYSGDATFASSSFTDHFSITAAVPTITLTTSVPTLSGTGSVTLTAVVDTLSFYEGPTGSITFFNNGNPIGSAVPVTAGRDPKGFPTATSTVTTTLPAQANSITAVYSGDGNFASVTSAAYTLSPKLEFVAVTPCRIADTRNAAGPFGGPELAAGATRDFAVPASSCAIPSTAVAYSMNVTVVPNTALGFLTLWPAGQTQPLTSLLNSDGRVKANAAIVPAGANGAVSVYVSDASNVILDINGYFIPADSNTLAFYPLTPCRVADTRNATGPLGDLSSQRIQPGTFQ